MKFERYGMGIAKGLAVTFRHLFRHPITVQYPEQRLAISRRARGNELVWDPHRCTGCAICAKACPQGNIEIVTSRKPDNTYLVEKFEVDTGRCMMDGLCVESCPFEALFMSRNYEKSRYRRKELVMSLEDMQISPEHQVSGYAHPSIEQALPLQTLLIDQFREK